MVPIIDNINPKRKKINLPLLKESEDYKVKFITILVPIRNEETYIGRCLNSIMHQDYDAQGYEVIVIDGISEDETRSIVRCFQKDYKNIKLIDNPNKIVPTALNMGLKASKGHIIIRVDGHAEIAPNYLQQCVEKLRLSNAECVGGYIESVNKTILGKAIALAMSSKFGVGNARFRTSGKPGFVDTIAFGAYRKEIFEKIGFFNEELIRGQDDEFHYRLRKSGGKIYFSPEIRSKYYPRSSLSKLWRQYFAYGYWKVRVLQKHVQMMQVRQFVPPVFVSICFVSGISGMIIPAILYWGLIPILGVYFFTSILVSLFLFWRNGWYYFFLLPVIFSTLHFSWGIGFLWGLIRFAPRLFDHEK